MRILLLDDSNLPLAAMLSHWHKWLFPLLFLVLPHSAFAGNATDLPAATYRTTVSEIRVTFFATDDKNRPVDKIEKDDFAVVDNGMVIRDFRSLMRSDETALDVVALVDASESVAPRFQATVYDVLQLVSQKQSAPDHAISVMSFSGLQATLLCSDNCRSTGSGQRLLAAKAEGATPLFDALAYSADFVAQRRAPGVRPVLILLSDGDDTISKISSRDAVEAVIASGANVYAIDSNRSGSASHSSMGLQRIAEATGGRYFPAEAHPAEVLRSAQEDLHASYIVTYQLPSHTAGFHSLRILPKHNLNLQFHCRSGYYYGTKNP